MPSCNPSSNPSSNSSSNPSTSEPSLDPSSNPSWYTVTALQLFGIWACVDEFLCKGTHILINPCTFYIVILWRYMRWGLDIAGEVCNGTNCTKTKKEVTHLFNKLGSSWRERIGTRSWGHLTHCCWSTLVRTHFWSLSSWILVYSSFMFGGIVSATDSMKPETLTRN